MQPFAGLPLFWRAVVFVINAIFFLTEPTVLYYSVYVVFTYLGQFVSHLFFAFHLLDLVHRVETLRAVVRSVTYNGRQLLMTVVLVVVVVYLYSIVEFTLFRDTTTVVRVCACVYGMYVYVYACVYVCVCRTMATVAPSMFVKPCISAISSH
jgi:hypothetical protein